MNPQQFATLAAVTAGSVVLAIAAYTAAAPWQAAVSQGKLFPGFTDTAQKVQRIEVLQGKSQATLERKGDAWTLKDRDGYPADSEKVRALLTGLTTADLVEQKTRKVERYTQLEVEDPMLASANSNLLRLIDDQGRTVHELIIGKKSADAFGAARAGTFVRKPGEDLTWLVDASLEANSDVTDWVKPRIFETPAEKIRKIVLEIPGEPPLGLSWDGINKRLKLDDVPKGKRVKFANSIDDIGEAISTFDLADVRKATALASPEPVSVANVEIDGGLKVTFRVRTDKDGDWLTFTATGEGEPKKFAEDLSAAVKDWEFKLPRGKAGDMFKKRSDLLEDDTVDTEVGPGAVKPDASAKP